MRWFTRHPGERALNRFADGELGEREHARVATHLAGCPRCREEVSLVRRIGDVARTLPSPLATDEVLRRALARRAAGERVLLPLNDAGAPRPHRARRLAPAAIAAMLTLMMVGLVVSVQVLEADRPGLRLHPERPRAGELLRMEYHGGALFADQSHLALRARYRTAEDRHWQLLAGILVRGDDGLYRTEVQLPDSVVYAAFAVEDLHGERVDSNNRELWDVMVHGEDGRPTLDAMTARLYDLEPRDWGAAYDLALRMTEEYPDQPQSWSLRLSFDLELFERDSVLARHQAMFAALERAAVEGGRLDAAAMAWLGIYALLLGDAPAAERWIGRAIARAPSLKTAADAESMLLLQVLGGDPASLVRELDRVWDRLPGGSKAVAHAGWQSARYAQDPDAITRWLERYLQARPAEELTLRPALYTGPELSAELVEWTTSFVRRPQRWHEAERPLTRSVEAHARAEARRLQRALSQTALASARSGDSGNAHALARIGADLSWDSEALLTIARVFLALGDTAGARMPLARAAADPLTARAAAAESWAAVRGPEWEERTAAAEAELRDYIERAAVLRYLPETLRITDGTGSRIRFADVHHGQPAVVVFLSRFCAPALDEARKLAGLQQRIEEVGGNLIIVNIDNVDGLAGFLEEVGLTAAVYRDPDGKARSAFLSSATPDYFVIDRTGRIRFEHSSAADLPRQLWALQTPRARVAALSD